MDVFIETTVKGRIAKVFPDTKIHKYSKDSYVISVKKLTLLQTEKLLKEFHAFQHTHFKIKPSDENEIDIVFFQKK